MNQQAQPSCGILHAEQIRRAQSPNAMTNKTGQQKTATAVLQGVRGRTRMCWLMSLWRSMAGKAGAAWPGFGERCTFTSKSPSCSASRPSSSDTKSAESRVCIAV